MTINNVSYYIGREFIGKQVVLRLDATSREFRVEYRQQEVKRLPIKGLVAYLLRFEDYLTRMCQEACTKQRRGTGKPHRRPRKPK